MNIIPDIDRQEIFEKKKVEKKNFEEGDGEVSNTAISIKAPPEDPWEFSKSQILFGGSLMSNKNISKMVAAKRSRIEENGRRL